MVSPTDHGAASPSTRTPTAPGKRGAGTCLTQDVGGRMTAEVKVSAQSLEQFLALAKSGQGAALVSLIHQLLEVPGVYVFGEVLQLPNVQELMRGPYSQTYHLLALFAYGTFSDYIANAANLPALTPPQKIKLRHLSIVSMAAKVKCIPYSVLLVELHMRNLRELEDLIIEAIYADIVQGKLDQRNQLLEVDFSIGRDIRQQDISAMSQTLQDWCSSCEAVLVGIEDQIHRADQYKDHQLKVRQQLDSEVSNLKKTLRATTGGSVQDSEQHLLEPRDPVTPQDQRQGTKKPSKGKGLRGSAKIWSKSN